MALKIHPTFLRGFSVDDVVRLMWLRSDFDQKRPQKSVIWVSSRIFMTLLVQFFVFRKCILKKFGALRNKLVWIQFFESVFEKRTKDSSRQRS